MFPNRILIKLILAGIIFLVLLSVLIGIGVDLMLRLDWIINHLIEAAL